jgi:archaeal chaperonin
MLSARLVAGIVRSSYGPRGLDKLFLDNIGQVHVTSDGATILSKSKSNHPIARIISELGTSVDREVGDGTTSSVILMSALLEEGVKLADAGVHPAAIVRGYTLALAKALDELDEVAERVPMDTEEWLIKVAATSLQTKLAAKGVEALPEMLASAALQVAEKRGDEYKIDLDKVNIRRMPGGSLSETRLIHGVVLEKDLIDKSMPKRLENVRIVVGDVSLVIKKTIAEAKLTMIDPKMVGRLGLERRAELKKMGDRLIATGANVVINREGMDDLVANQLARAGMMGVRHVKIADVTRLAEATGATVTNAKGDIRPEDLGFAELVEERHIEGQIMGGTWVFVEGCKDPKALTILLRGASWHIVDEAERSIKDALMAIKVLLEKPAVVSGGGAVEAELSSRIRKWSSTVEGREQMAAEAFARALEEIPNALATNSGMHAVDAIAELRSKHAQGGKWFGIDAKEAKVQDMRANMVFEPVAVKEEVLKAATETACLILRIDRMLDRTKVQPSRRTKRAHGDLPALEDLDKLSPSQLSRVRDKLAEKTKPLDPTKPQDARYPL